MGGVPLGASERAKRLVAYTVHHRLTEVVCGIGKMASYILSQRGLLFPPCRNHSSVINATEGLGLLIADEGHRLKNSAETKTTRALKACPAAMRLVMVRYPLPSRRAYFAHSWIIQPTVNAKVCVPKRTPALQVSQS